ncbi:MAG: tRNA-dihydrouridine synthase family protein [Muribaculaceae bacterium]|nr:tRNA-dihydrouridine synthase family protein [Muribaculaceae bacterium]
MTIHAAPVQGHTDAAWRHFHAAVYGQLADYSTPFIRLEKGEARKRDLNDAFSSLNDNHILIPQVIFKNETELTTLVAILKNGGAGAININMGCPFPLQTARGRGAATICRPDAAEAVRKVVEENPDIDFSVKLRLGMTERDEWKSLISVLNLLKLDHIILHPRVARQQYGGETDLDAFSEFLSESVNPVIYNGDINTPEDYRLIAERFPTVKGVMLGRGLLGRPSLGAEISEGVEWDKSRRLEAMKEFHRLLFRHYRDTLEGGDHQTLSKIIPFWEYAEQEIGRKAWKAIKKTSNMAKYNTALTLI